MNRSLIVALIAPLLLAIFSNSASSQSAKEAIRSLKELEAKTQAGTSHADYMEALGDAQLEVNSFSESSEAEAKPRLTQSIERVLLHYRFAGVLFDDWVSGKGCLLAIPKEEDPRLESIRGLRQAMLEHTECIMATYPETQAAISREWDGGCKPGYMDIEKAIRIIWQTGSEELSHAMRLHSELPWSAADTASYQPEKEKLPNPTDSTIHEVERELAELGRNPSTN